MNIKAGDKYKDCYGNVIVTRIQGDYIVIEYTDHKGEEYLYHKTVFPEQFLKR
jgi:hypothetical protein